MPRDKSRYRDRRSSSYSSESSYSRKMSKSSKLRRRSRSRDRSEASYKRRRSSSRSRRKHRSYSRSKSRDRYDSKSKRPKSRTKRSLRSVSVHRSRSRSHSRSRYSRSKHKSHRRSHSSGSRSHSVDVERPVVPKIAKSDDTEIKIEKAIKAAAAAGLTMTKIPTYEYKDVAIKEEMPTIHDRNLLAEINNDSFVPKTFTSSKNKKPQNIVIDLNTDTVKLPETEINAEKVESIIDIDALPTPEEQKEIWIKKLYQYRKKMLKGEI